MRTPDSPSIAARAARKRGENLLPGRLLTFTTVVHPPKGFGDSPRIIGLVELTNGKRVLAPLMTEHHAPAIGQEVLPRMILSRVNAQGLRIYDVAYECTARVIAQKPPVPRKFPGYILALTGPSGVGKTTVSVLLTIVAAEFVAKVPIVTTRDPKNGDEGEYAYVNLKEFEKLKRAGEIISWTRIPSETEERFYGYRKSDVTKIWKEGKVPVVVTEMHLLQGLAHHFGRRSILSCGLLPPGHSKRAMLSQLLHRLRKRGRETEEQIAERLRNAQEDLAFFDDARHLFDHILVNEDLDTVIRTLKGHVLELVEA